MKLLRFTDLRQLGIVKNRVTLSRWLRSGGFPRPVRLGPNSVAWREEEIKAWLDSRSREKRPEAAA
jgi:prophage regulatory protein